MVYVSRTAYTRSIATDFSSWLSQTSRASSVACREVWLLASHAVTCWLSLRWNPLALVTLELSVAQEVALALNVAQVPCEGEDETGADSWEEQHAVDKSKAV